VCGVPKEELAEGKLLAPPLTNEQSDAMEASKNKGTA
jgi:hypothetical protein